MANEAFMCRETQEIIVKRLRNKEQKRRRWKCLVIVGMILNLIVLSWRLPVAYMTAVEGKCIVPNIQLITVTYGSMYLWGLVVIFFLVRGYFDSLKREKDYEFFKNQSTVSQEYPSGRDASFR